MRTERRKSSYLWIQLSQDGAGLLVRCIFRKMKLFSDGTTTELRNNAHFVVENLFQPGILTKYHAFVIKKRQSAVYGSYLSSNFRKNDDKPLCP